MAILNALSNPSYLKNTSKLRHGEDYFKETVNDIVF